MTTPDGQRRYRFLVVAPLPPSRGGIAHFSAMLCAQLRTAHDITVWRIDPLYPPWLFPGNAQADPSARPIPTHVDAYIHGWSPISWWRSWHAITPSAYDAVIWQWWTPYWIPFLVVLLWLARRRGIPTIALNHQLVEPDAPPWQRSLAIRMLNRAGAVVSFGTPSHTQVQESVLPLPVHAAVLGTAAPCGADLGSGSQRARLGIPADAFVVLCYGFVRPYKGTDIIVAALHDAVPQLHLVIAGEWWHTDSALRAACAHPAVRTRVHIDDRYIPNEETAALFAACDCVALPYRSGTVSGVATLAAATGVPLLTSAVGALGGHAAACAVVHPNTPAAWAAALSRLATQPRAPRAPVPSQPGWLALQRAIEEHTTALRGAS